MKKLIFISIAFLVSCSKEESNTGTDICFQGNCYQMASSNVSITFADTQVNVQDKLNECSVSLRRNSVGLYADVTYKGGRYLTQYNITPINPRITSVSKPKINPNFVYKNGKVTINDIIYLYDSKKVNDSTKIELRLNFTTK